jgi:hypothetical protein
VDHKLCWRDHRLVTPDHGQYLLVVDGDPGNASWAGQVRNGLADDNEGLLAIFTGGGQLRVRVEMEAWLGVPEIDEERWDDVIEVGLTTMDGDVRVQELLRNVDGMPNLAHKGAGSYRLRFSVRGRPQSPHSLVREVHRIQCWPTTTKDVVGTMAIKLTDAVGARRRGESAPPMLAWELEGARAMKDFVASLRSVTSSGRKSTVVVSKTFPLSPLDTYNQLIYLPSLVGDGGSGELAVGHSAMCDVYDSSDFSQRLKLQTMWRTASPPASAEWLIKWLLYTDSYSEFILLEGRGSLELSIRERDHETVASFTQKNVPAEWVEALQALWEYWLSKRLSLLTEGTATATPWHRIG